MYSKQIFLFVAAFTLALASCDEPVPVTNNLAHDSLINRAEEYNRLFLRTRKSDPVLAASYVDSVQKYSELADYDLGRAYVHSGRGNEFYYQNNFADALSEYLLALNLYDSLRDSSGIANSSYVIGKIHRQQKIYPRALEYSFRALSIHTALGDSASASSDLNGVGNIYAEMQQYDTARMYFEQRLPIERARGDSAAVASALSDMAAAYTANGDAEKGLEFHQLALSRLGELRIDSTTWYLLKFKSGVLLDIAGEQFLLNDHGAALRSAEEALSIAEQINARKEKRNAYRKLAELNGLIGREDRQLQYMELFIALNDSLLNEESVAQVADADARYQSAQKEKVIADLNASQAEMALTALQLEENRRMLIIGLIVFALLAGSTIIILRARARMKLRREQFRSVIEGEEAERKRIAMELHDGLGQLLSTARLNVSGLEENIVPEDDSVLKTSLSLIDDACTEVRNISHNLMPAALIRTGLVAALRELSGRISASGKITVNFEHDQYKAKLRNETEIAVYRIVQEVVNNALKYSKADVITISLSGTAQVHVLVKDNGIGMPAESQTKSTGIGWKNIRSRVEMMNGKLQVNSSPGNGTSVSLTVIPEQQ